MSDPLTAIAGPRVQDALIAATRLLREAGIDGAQGDARRLMADALGIEAGRLTLAGPDPIWDKALARFRDHVGQRLARRPVSRILGWRDFFGLRFRISDQTLDPRPETETLVSEGLAGDFTRVLDLGTGSGCILIALLAGREGATGLGTDLSDGALAVAAENAETLGVAARADFRRSDWFADVEGVFDLIVSNPPYIALEEMAALAPEVSGHDPRLALTDEGDGLACYRIIAGGAPQHLQPGGRLMVEIGWTQGPAVADLFRTAGLSDVRIVPDLDGRDRVVTGRKPG
ncbi:peptide chain release factor N(5)-glutamine methyltransferase [Pseudooceanicola atlanticus]|uniref:peptide chain release factor N(5)-glutamine methyltransferase n=1 Tax=Pseudooceanicola atlanticus TaxID=1461694 RepID=UPI000A816824|nr:peptide chain release factor N(5)-glutamine methyltransferase [Pseudooceanicola atlanticus]